MSRNNWTPRELKTLRRCYRNKPIPEMQNLLPNRTRNAIVAKASALHISKPREPKLDRRTLGKVVVWDDDFEPTLWFSQVAHRMEHEQ